MGRVVKLQAGTWTFGRTKMVESTTASGGKCSTSMANGTREVDLVIEIHEEELIRAIGRRAAFSKRGVTKLQAGAIVVRVVRKVDHDPPPDEPRIVGIRDAGTRT